MKTEYESIASWVSYRVDIGGTGAPIPGRRPNAKASVLGVFPDAVYTRLIDIEANTVPMFHPEYLPEILENGLRIRIAYP